MISTEELVSKVRRLVNEADCDQSISLITDDARSLDATIEELLPQAVALVQKRNGKGYVNIKSTPPNEADAIVVSEGFATFTLPKDYVSLVSVKLSNWKIPVTNVSSPVSAEAVRQGSAATRASSSRPVCVESVANDSRRVLYMYPVTDGCKMEHLIYETLFNVDDGLDECDNGMGDAVAYACAALLYNLFDRYDASKSFMAYAMALCGSNENV